MSNTITSSTRLLRQAGMALAFSVCSLATTKAFAQAGPIATAQTAVLQSKLNVTAEFVAQTYNDVTANGTGTGLQFGATQNLAGTMPGVQPTWVPLNQVSDPSAQLFSNISDLTAPASFSIFSATRPLAAAGLATDGRYLMGQLRLRFEKPVVNPTLQIVGLGGAAGSLRFSSELELLTQNVGLSKLSGNANLNVIDNQILNGAETPDASSASGAASGSVLASGENITELVFDVYVRGAGTADSWEQPNTYIGDRWQIGCSINESAAANSTRLVALPVYVSGFMVNQEMDCEATLRWKSVTELGITSFIAEHSTDGINFFQVATFESAGGAEGVSYRYAMPNTPAGNNYFRVKINNSLGLTGYTATHPVNVKCHTVEVSVQPNPSNGILHIRGMEAGTTLSLFNMSGREVRSTLYTEPVTILNISDLHEGIYMLISRDANGVEKSRTRVQKI